MDIKVAADDFDNHEKMKMLSALEHHLIQLMNEKNVSPTLS